MDKNSDTCRFCGLKATACTLLTATSGTVDPGRPSRTSYVGRGLSTIDVVLTGKASQKLLAKPVDTYTVDLGLACLQMYPRR